jgi:oligo-1,6-glucosidase
VTVAEPAVDTDLWWQRAVVYQVYPRSFADSNGDGIGDLPGVTARLDHLAALGVDVLWLSPFYPSPQADNGYDISDHTDVDPMFGTLADFDELLAQAHARGLRVIVDVVPNHTSDRHPWFLDSRSGGAKRDWYIWRPPRPGHVGGTPGAEPTNWESFFSGPTWAWDDASGEYYLHLFSTGQPDLNWENPDVRKAFADVLRFWLDRGVDGFRFDVLNLISKDPRYPDGTVRDGTTLGDGSPFYTSGPRVHEYVAELVAAVRESSDKPLLLVGETPGVTVEEGLLFTDRDRREVDMVFQFEHVGLDQGEHKFDLRPFDLLALKAVFGRWERALGDTGWNSLYWNNHDQPRVVSRFGDDGEHRIASATMLATVLHLHRGTPFVYQGEELGMANAEFAGVDDFADIESINYWHAALAAGVPQDVVLAGLRKISRDNARTPIPWDEAARQRTDPGSVYAYYRRLADLRHTDDTVVHGDFGMLLPDHPAVYAFTRTLGERRLLVLGNFSGTEQPIALDAAPARLVLGNLDEPAEPFAPLRPWEARVLLLG